MDAFRFGGLAAGPVLKAAGCGNGLRTIERRAVGSGFLELTSYMDAFRFGGLAAGSVLEAAGRAKRIGSGSGTREEKD